MSKYKRRKIMENYNVVLECFEKNDEPMNTTAVAEKTGIDKKEVSKVMDKLKKEEKIYSPKRCYWQIKRQQEGLSMTTLN